MAALLELNIGDFVEFVPLPAPVAAPIPKLWYLLRLHPNHDLKAEKELHERGISAYLPKEPKTRKTGWNRVVTSQVPIFPGTMFIPDFDANIEKLKATTTGIGGFVQRDGKALRVWPRDMAEIRAYERQQNSAQKRKYHVGQRVRITKGPFDMWEGEIERLDSRYRLMVLIRWLGAMSSLSLDEDQVEAV